jgi:hypothetical protein
LFFDISGDNNIEYVDVMIGELGIGLIDSCGGVVCKGQELDGGNKCDFRLTSDSNSVEEGEQNDVFILVD